MTYFRGIAVVILASSLIGCDLFTADESREDRTLYPLHHAILGLLDADAVDADSDGHSDSSNDAVAHRDQSTDSGANGEPTAGEDSHDEASADAEAHAESLNSDKGHSGPSELNTDSITGTISVAVVAIVDSFSLSTPSEEDEEADTALRADAKRRERVARQEIQDSLIENTFINVLPRDNGNENKARAEIIANNSAELSTVLASEIGNALAARVIVCVLIDEAGREVNIVAQQTIDGMLIYQETIMDWKPVMEAIAEPETE